MANDSLFNNLKNGKQFSPNGLKTKTRFFLILCMLFGLLDNKYFDSVFPAECLIKYGEHGTVRERECVHGTHMHDGKLSLHFCTLLLN